MGLSDLMEKPLRTFLWKSRGKGEEIIRNITSL